MKTLSYILAIFICVNCQNAKTINTDKEKIIKDILVQKVPEYKKTEINWDKSDTLIKVSEPFVINNIKCYWKLTFIVYEGEEYGNGALELKNQNTHKTLLSTSDIFSFDDSYYTHSFNGIHFESLNMDYFEDLNFDGYKDFKSFDKPGSGSAGMYYRAYIFNSKKKTFEYVENLSGYGLTVNKTDRTLETYSKSGFGWNSSNTHYFDKNGKIKYTEIIEREVIPKDTIDLLKTTYEKIINDKVIETKIDTTKFEGW